MLELIGAVLWKEIFLACSFFFSEKVYCFSGSFTNEFLVERILAYGEEVLIHSNAWAKTKQRIVLWIITGSKRVSVGGFEFSNLVANIYKFMSGTKESWKVL